MGLVVAMALGGVVLGAVLALFTAHLREQRRARESA